MTPTQTAQLVAVLIASYPYAKITPATSSAYERMLGDLDYPAANAAIERLLATSRFMPTVAEIRETTLALESGETKPGGEAWGSVLKAIRGAGIYRQPGTDFVFADAVTAQCVSALGWEELCNSENTTADRARFIELYDQLAVQYRRKQLSEPLPAMQRFREHQRKQLEARGATSVGAAMGKVLELVAGDDK